jgi:HEAT repeat protein
MKLLCVLLVGLLAPPSFAQDLAQDEIQAVLGRAARYRKPDARVHYLLSRGQDSELRRQAVETILAREEGLDDVLFRAARKERRGANRRLALLALYARGADLELLLKQAVGDRDKTVLPALASRIRTDGRGPEAVGIVAPGLGAKKTAQRVRSAKALGELGDASAVEPLRKSLEAQGCPCTRQSPRANVAVLKQIAYVGRYEVEIA